MTRARRRGEVCGLLRRTARPGLHESVVGYDRHGSTLVLLHTATREDLRHRGHASTLVEMVLAEVSAQPEQVVVRCPFVRWWQTADTGQQSRPCVT